MRTIIKLKPDCAARKSLAVNRAFRILGEAINVAKYKNKAIEFDPFGLGKPHKEYTREEKDGTPRPRDVHSSTWAGRRPKYYYWFNRNAEGNGCTRNKAIDSDNYSHRWQLTLLSAFWEKRLMMQKINHILLNMTLTVWEKIIKSIPQKKETEIRVHETPRCRIHTSTEDQKDVLETQTQERTLTLPTE